MTNIPYPPKDNLPTILPVTAPTPHEMLSRAVLADRPIEVIERLATLVERFDDRQIRKAFENAMAEARAEGIPAIIKSAKVDFTTSKGRTNYAYETFADVAGVADEVFPKHGITYRFRTKQEGNRVTVTCIISHKDGYWEENSLSGMQDESGNKNLIQAVGSTVTYLERYTLKAALGLAASADDDGQAASGVRQNPHITRAADVVDIPAADDPDRVPPPSEPVAELPKMQQREVGQRFVKDMDKWDSLEFLLAWKNLPETAARLATLRPEWREMYQGRLKERIMELRSAEKMSMSGGMREPLDLESEAAERN